MQPMLPFNSKEYETMFEDEELVDKELAILRHVFGFPSFRERQQDILKTVLHKHDVIVLMPTGGGKTIIYVICGSLLKGVSFVIQPLKSLMQEQVKHLRQKNIIAFVIGSYWSDERVNSIIDFEKDPALSYAFIFTSPEKMLSSEISGLVTVLQQQTRLGIIAVDEAHCIDIWGGSFRDACSKMATYVQKFQLPVVALSGSATDCTVQVITEKLALNNPLITRSSFKRSNLKIEVKRRNDKPMPVIVKRIKEELNGKCGIVYCAKRNTTKELAYALNKQDVTATFVRGGLQDLERKRNEALWKEGKVMVVCTTN